MTVQLSLGRRALTLELAQAARPITDEEWGSERQIEAENYFFAEVECILPRDVWEEFEGWCLKATTNEMIDRALVLMGISNV